jgi:hypothetical protein
VRDATRFAPHCPQSAGPFGQASTSEDCLFLNVFTPRHQQAGSHFPVMVWIHGGALVSGESNDYDPAGLVAHGVTVVTVNYRLGALGFLAHPALADANGQSGDYGLMDQQAALRWVQRNIASFGGNPHNVTVFGESAGGLSTLAQVASPQARGLFERAIVESGSYNLTQASLASAESAGEAFAVKAGAWLVLLLAGTGAALSLRSLAAGRPAWFVLVAGLVLIVAEFGFFLITPRLLLNLPFAWRDLVPGAAICTAAAVVVHVVATLFLRNWFGEYGHAYGGFGVGLALIAFTGIIASFWVWIAAAMGVWWERRAGPAAVAAMGKLSAEISES